MKKKIFVLFISVILLTGCDITYDLKISKKNIEEMTTVIEDSTKFYNDNQDQLFYSNYVNTPIPLSKNVPIPTPNSNNATNPNQGDIRDVKYYNVNNISSDGEIGMIYKGKFNVNSIGESRFASAGAPDCSFNEKNNVYSLNVSNLSRMFKQFPSLDSITVNITCDDVVVSNNADKKSGNVYTWYVTKENYDKKSIEFKFSDLSMTNYAKQGFDNAIKNTPNKEMILISIILIVCLVVLYCFVKRKTINSNKF